MFGSPALFLTGRCGLQTALPDAREPNVTGLVSLQGCTDNDDAQLWIAGAVGQSSAQQADGCPSGNVTLSVNASTPGPVGGFRSQFLSCRVSLHTRVIRDRTIEVELGTLTDCGCRHRRTVSPGTSASRVTTLTFGLALARLPRTSSGRSGPARMLWPGAR